MKEVFLKTWAITTFLALAITIIFWAATGELDYVPLIITQAAVVFLVIIWPVIKWIIEL